MNDELRSEWRGGIPGWTDGHRWVPLIAGGAEDGGTDDTDDDTDDDDDDDDEPDPALDKIKDPEAYARSLKEANERLARKVKKKDGLLSDVTKRLQELEDKDKDEDTKRNDQLVAAQKERDDLGERVRRLEVENTVLTREELAGVPARRRKMIVSTIMPDLEVEDDGESNLDELLAELKKDDPDLFEVKVKDEDDDDDEDTSASTNGNRSKKTPPKTGGAKKRKDKDQQTDRASFEKRFPALRR